MRNKLNRFELIRIFIQLNYHIYYRDTRILKVYGRGSKDYSNYSYKINYWRQLLENHKEVWNYIEISSCVQYLEELVFLEGLPKRYLPYCYKLAYKLPIFRTSLLPQQSEKYRITVADFKTGEVIKEVTISKHHNSVTIKLNKN